MSDPLSTVVVQITQTTAGLVSSPATGTLAMYANLTDHLIYVKNSSGTSTAVGGGSGSGSVTSIAAGTGMSFTTITTSGSVAVDTAVVARYAATGNFTKAQTVASVSLGALVTGTIATDASTGNVFIVSLAGTCTLGNPTNMVSGQTLIWEVSQDTAGNRTLAYGNAFTWPGAVTPTLSTAASAVDVITAVYTGSKLRAVMNKAFG